MNIAMFLNMIAEDVAILYKLHVHNFNSIQFK